MISFPIFERFGGQQAALDILAKRRGKHVSEHALERWKMLRQIPDWAAMALLEESEARGIPFHVEECRATQSAGAGRRPRFEARP